MEVNLSGRILMAALLLALPVAAQFESAAVLGTVRDTAGGEDAGTMITI